MAADLHPLHTYPSLPLPTITTAATAAITTAVGTAIPAKPPAMESHDAVSDESDLPMKCCCGRDECVFLKHNCTLLDSVEREVHTAARMGQVSLLSR